VNLALLRFTLVFSRNQNIFKQLINWIIFCSRDLLRMKWILFGKLLGIDFHVLLMKYAWSGTLASVSSPPCQLCRFYSKVFPTYHHINPSDWFDLVFKVISKRVFMTFKFKWDTKVITLLAVPSGIVIKFKWITDFFLKVYKF